MKILGKLNCDVTNVTNGVEAIEELKSGAERSVTGRCCRLRDLSSRSKKMIWCDWTC